MSLTTVRRRLLLSACGVSALFLGWLVGPGWDGLAIQSARAQGKTGTPPKLPPRPPKVDSVGGSAAPKVGPAAPKTSGGTGTGKSGTSKPLPKPPASSDDGPGSSPGPLPPTPRTSTTIPPKVVPTRPGSSTGDDPELEKLAAEANRIATANGHLKAGRRADALKELESGYDPASSTVSYSIQLSRYYKLNKQPSESLNVLTNELKNPRTLRDPKRIVAVLDELDLSHPTALPALVTTLPVVARRTTSAASGKPLPDHEYSVNVPVDPKDPSKGSVVKVIRFADSEEAPDDPLYSFPGGIQTPPLAKGKLAKKPESQYVVPELVQKPGLSRESASEVDRDMTFAAKVRAEGRLNESLLIYKAVAARLETGDGPSKNPALLAAARSEIDKTTDKLKSYPTVVAAALSSLPPKEASAAAGKLYMELSKNPPVAPSVAARAALLFTAAGDDERAARMYRRVIELAELVPDDPASQKLAIVAKDYLRSQKLPEKAKYSYQRTVNPKYTSGIDGTRRPNARNIEEETPQDDASSQIKRATELLSEGRIDLDTYRGYLVAFGCKPPTMTKRELQQIVVEGFATEAKGQDPAAIAQSRARLSELNIADDLLAKFDDIAIRNISAPNYRAMLKELQDRRVQYLKSTAERNEVEILGEKGILVRRTGAPLNTAEMSSLFGGEGSCIYVMSPDGRIYVNSGILNKIHHSTFLAGTETAGAGELQVQNGILRSINNKSGHYTPQVVHLAQTLHELQSKGVKIQGVNVKVYGLKSNSSTSEPEDFGDAQQFLELYKGDRAQFRQLWKDRGFKTDPYDGVEDLDFIRG